MHNHSDPVVLFPKKKFLRYLAARGLTILLDEYRTSKCCPFCHGELEDAQGKNRVRRCKNDLNGLTCILSSLKDEECDRDDLATINMIMCAIMLIETGKRPSYLCRPKNLLQLRRNNQFALEAFRETPYIVIVF